MHRALGTFDILCEIFQYLLRSRKALYRRSQNPLVNCALVCKDFSDPALDVLWRELDHILPLLKVISTFQWDSAIGKHRLTGEISSKDFEAFKAYACRVRVLRCRYDNAIHPESVLEIARCNDRRCLLPCLQRLTWSQSSPYDTVLLSLVSASLRVLDFNLSSIYRASLIPAPYTLSVETLLTSVLSKATSLEELHLSGLKFPIASSPMVHVQRLHTVELKTGQPTVSRLFLESLSKAEKLVDLSINVPTQDFPGVDICAFEHHNAFPALQFLHVRGSFLHMSQLLRAASSSSIEYLHLDAFDSDCLSDFRTFLASMRVKVGVWSTALHTVQLDLQVPLGKGIELRVMDLFGPILGAPNLKVVRIDTPFISMDLTDGDVDRLAHAWPGIMELALFGEFAGLASLPAIVAMVGRCSKLHKLSLPVAINNETPLALEVEGRTAPVSMHFKELDFKNVRFAIGGSQAERLGVLLERFFPRIDFNACMGFQRKYTADEWKYLRPLQLSILHARSQMVQETQILP